MKTRRVFDEVFKEMAVELSYAKGSVQEAARELGIDSGRITKWRQSRKSPSQTPTAGLSEEQKQIKQLQKELKEAQIERDILKKAVSIFSRGDGKYSGL
jgi:transposase